MKTSAHRPWTATPEALEDTLARREEWILSKTLTFTSAGTKHRVKTNGLGTALRGAVVTPHHGDRHPSRQCPPAEPAHHRGQRPFALNAGPCFFRVLAGSHLRPVSRFKGRCFLGSLSGFRRSSQTFQEVSRPSPSDRDGYEGGAGPRFSRGTTAPSRCPGW